MQQAKRVAITGAAGQICYSLLFRIASGDMLGKDQPVILQLLEIPQALDVLKGTVMELNDCAFPLLAGVIATSEPAEAFKDADVALFVGAKPRGPGMERADLLKDNGKIFAALGHALSENANPECKVCVVGNPANTNAYILRNKAPKINPRNITALTRLDHNRAMSQLAEKTNSTVADIQKMIIWGNHSTTQVPDLSYTQVSNKAALEQVDQTWAYEDFIPTVAKRGAAVINARGASSAASAANGIVDHIRSWALGTEEGDWVSMAVPSDGSYGIQEGLIYSYPVTCKNGDYSIVQGLEINDFYRGKMTESENELKEEAAEVAELLS